MRPEEYLKNPYARILIPEEEGFSAEILEFPGCFAVGRTADEAFKNLECAAISWIEAALSQGQEIPSPSMSQGYGGRIALRLPKGIHRRASELAQRENISLNQFILSAVAAKIGAEDFCSALIKRMDQHVMYSVSKAMASTLATWGEGYFKNLSSLPLQVTRTTAKTSDRELPLQ